MSFTEFPSRLLENAVNEFASLPGIGRKTAFRLVMNLLKRDSEEVKKFGESIIRLHDEIHYCKICNNISDTEICLSLIHISEPTRRTPISYAVFCLNKKTQ